MPTFSTDLQNAVFIQAISTFEFHKGASVDTITNIKPNIDFEVVKVLFC